MSDLFNKESATQLALPGIESPAAKAPKRRYTHGSLPSFFEFLQDQGGLEDLLGGMGDVRSHYVEVCDMEEPGFEDMTPEEQEEAVDSLALRDLEQRYDEAVSEHESSTFPRELYREVSLKGGIESLKLDGIGEYWAFDESKAQAHWGHFDIGYRQVMLRAKVPESAVDWESTLWANLDPSTGEDEAEVRLFEGSRFELTGWRERREHAWHEPAPKQRFVTASTRIAAPRSIWYHGSSIKNLRSILSQGLIPDVKKKNWDSDPDASVGQPSREAYGGIYVTSNLMTATAAPRDKRQTGGYTLVIMELQPNTMYLDEDDLMFTMSSPIGHLSENAFQVGCFYIAATQAEAQEGWREEAEKYKNIYVETAMKSVAYKFEQRGKTVHDDLKKRVSTLLEQAWLPALTRLATHWFSEKNDNYTWRRCWYQVMGKWDGERTISSEPVEPGTAVPTIKQAEAGYRNAVEPVTRALRQLAVPHDEEEFKRQTARVTTPIGYSGSNRILAVLEISDPYQRKSGEPVDITVRYGTIPPDFFKQWKTRYGSEINLVDPKKGGDEIPAQAKTSSAEYPLAGPVVDGLAVRKGVPNTDSIGSTLNDFEVIAGIRAVPLDAFNSAPLELFYAADDVRRTGELANAIEQSGEINPLIVAIDNQGPYILEGAHRLGALHLLGKKHFPALVVLDLEPLSESEGTKKVAFIPNDVVWLKNYLTMSDRDKGEELARGFSDQFREFLEQAHPDLMEALQPQYDEYEYLDDFGTVPDSVLAEFLDKEGSTILSNDPAYAPLFLHASYEGLVKNQWLVHFTDEAFNVSWKGFTRGIDDMALLGLTTNFTDKAKTRGGYNFAYLLSDFDRYGFEGRSGDPKYGKECVMFRASGVKIHHYGDNEPQVVFWGKDARDIIPIVRDDEGYWCLPNDDHDKPVYRSEGLTDVAAWVPFHFAQYRSVLLTNKDGKPKPKLPKAASWTPSAAASTALKAIEPRAGEEFKDWLRSYLDNEQEFEEAWTDDSLRLDYLNDWLRDQHQIDVRDDGYITFWTASPEVEELIGDLPVTVYHHTSSGLLPQIKREGLRADARKSNSHQNSGAGVYVTTEVSGPVVEGYKRNAIQRRKGAPVTLEIHTTLRDLSPDPDDEDIASGEVQFVLPYVPPQDIVFPERRRKGAAQKTAGWRLPPGYRPGKQRPENLKWMWTPEKGAVVFQHGSTVSDDSKLHGEVCAANGIQLDKHYFDRVPRGDIGFNPYRKVMSVYSYGAHDDEAAIDDVVSQVQRMYDLSDWKVSTPMAMTAATSVALPRGYELPKTRPATVRWLYSPTTGAILFAYRTPKGESTVHPEVAAEFMGAAAYGNAFDRLPRGTAELNEVRKSVVILSYGAYPSDSAIRDVVEAVKEEYHLRGWKDEFIQLGKAASVRVGADQATVEAPVQDVTQTAAFKAWFAGSEVVDAHGKPQVMYHATQDEIGEFRPYTHFGTQQAANDRQNSLIDFYDNVIKNPARSQGANIIPVYLSVKNSIRLPDLASLDSNTGEPLENFDEAEDMDEEDRPYARAWEGEEAIATTLLEVGIIDIDEFEEHRNNRRAMDLLKEKGYDGIVYENVVEDPGHDSWIVFSPNQVKSAIGNSGEFDSESKSITASIEEPQIQPWLGVDLDGTLASNLNDYSDPTLIGPPIPAMVEKVRKAIENGETIKVFTARMADKENAEKIRAAIGDWTEEHIGTRLDATNEKDPGMVELWDDRARQVDKGTGMFSVADIHIVASRETQVKIAEVRVLASNAGFDDDGYWAGDGNAASGILPIAKDTGRLCLTWRSAEVHTGDCWGIPGGAVKDGQTAAESARLEMKEEVGYSGAIDLRPAYTFADHHFRYFNFIGLISSEFEFNPSPSHAWETDLIAWVTFEDLVADIENNPGDYHPGLIALFKNSRELIERLVGAESTKTAVLSKNPALKPDANYLEGSNGWALFPDQREGAYERSPVDAMVPLRSEEDLTPEQNWVENV